MAKMSIYGMERYEQYYDRSLFSGLSFPEGIDKDIAVNTILLDSSEFEALYPDADFLREAITLWGLKFYYTFEKWQHGFNQEFSPIDNYDKHEEYTTNEGYEDKTTYGKKDTTTFGRKDTTTYGKTDTTTHGKTDTTTYGKTDTTTYGKTTTETHEVSAFDSSSYQPKDKTTTGTANTDSLASAGTDTVATTGTDTVAGSGTDSIQLSGSDSVQLSGSDTINGKKNFTYKNYTHGNIGVSKTTEILADWFDTYEKYNIYKMISDCFVTEFCLMIY